MSNIMEEIFEFLDKNQNDQAVQLIKENLTKRDQSFIEDLVPSLGIITNTSIEVVEAIMPSLLGILNFDDDVIRYSIIISIKKFVEEHKELIFPYIEDFLKYGSPKKREGILLLLQYVAETDPKSMEPYYDIIITELADSEDYVRKKAVEVLQAIGKEDRNEIESRILKFLKSMEEESQKQQNGENILKAADEILAKNTENSPIDPVDQILIDAADKVLKKGSDGSSKRAPEDELRDAAGSVLKEIVDIKSLEKIELEKRQMEAQSKALKEKIEENDQKMQLEKLQLEEEQRLIEQKRLEQEKERLKKEVELLEKQQELNKVKQELELKRIEEEKAHIIAKEAKRIQKKMNQLEKEGDSEDEFEELL
ncbi:hypothetical protein NEF87_000116 [Candidatus Lokiarchaeum ossiferum]|uniref:HEAT repeat domain-containing protein n=1 Tax=Candidatus Lokiarchaeum ossiferum TaxID=2951803 RepID=A0ABY6HMN7_9ARCH|nr:hypothetical protein NEF87_000116 [Candidatus Lokiarchaeum sp. B-35]